MTISQKQATDELALKHQRNARIIAIKAAQRQLGMDDATYRAMLMAQVGKSSATELSLSEAALVLEYLRRCGATRPDHGSRVNGRSRSTPSNDRAALMHRVHTLLEALEQCSGRPHTVAYADAICQRNGWCDRVDFATPELLHRLVGALTRTLLGRSKRSNGGSYQ